MICILGLLLLSIEVFGQPVEGPWVIVTSDNAIISPEVCVRDSEADILFIENDSARYARFSLITHEMTAGPTAVFGLQGWGVQQLHDLIRVNDTTWACAASEDEGPDYPGHNDVHHRTHLIFGGEQNASSRGLDSSVTHWYFPVEGEYWNEGFSLAPRVGGGAVGAWISSYFNGFDLSIGFSVVVFDSVLTEDFRQQGGLGLLWNPPENRMIVRSVTADFWLGISAGYFYLSNCQFAVARDFGLTHSGNQRAVVCDEDWDCAPYVISIETIDSTTCTNLGTVDLPAGTHASFWHPNYGFAILHASPNSLQLARVDTNGIQFLPTGTLFWRDSLHTFGEANLTITDAGVIVALWTETQDGDTTARRLMLGSVGWDTPLASDPSDFIPQPSNFSLSAYPNPFNGETTITYELPQRAKVELAIYNLLGERVALLKSVTEEAGRHTVQWKPEVSSGIYFARLFTPPLAPPLKQGGNAVMTKLVYLR